MILIVHYSLFVLSVYSILEESHARTSRDACCLFIHVPTLAALAAAQTNDLAVLLQLGDKLVTLLHDVVVSSRGSVIFLIKHWDCGENLLLVLVVRPLRLDHALHTVNCAGQPVAGDERRKVLVEPRHANTERAGHALQADNLVTLQKLCISAKSHFTHKPVLVLEEVTIL